MITNTATGDLNKDGVDDFALMLSCKDSVKIKDGFKCPRMLLLGFKVNDHYELKLQHHTLLEYENINDNDNTGDWDGNPLEALQIVKGVLKFRFHWDVRGAGFVLQYMVRYQSGDFYLIGATSEIGYRTSITKAHFNFSTSKYTYDEVDEARGFGGELIEQHKKGKLPANAIKKLSGIKTPGVWSIISLANI